MTERMEGDEKFENEDNSVDVNVLKNESEQLKAEMLNIPDTVEHFNGMFANFHDEAHSGEFNVRGTSLARQMQQTISGAVALV